MIVVGGTMIKWKKKYLYHNVCIMEMYACGTLKYSDSRGNQSDGA